MLPRRSTPLALLLVALTLVALAAAPAAQAGIPERILGVARTELRKGVREIPAGSDNSPGIARYRTAFAWRAPVAAWCGYFVSYVTRQAGVPLGTEGEGLGAVHSIRRWAIRTGRWRPRGPRPGDLWIKRNIGHVGIVERVEGASIVSLDGNYSDRVARTHRARSQIAGFVRLAVGERIVGAPPAERSAR